MGTSQGKWGKYINKPWHKDKCYQSYKEAPEIEYMSANPLEGNMEGLVKVVA